MADEDFFREQHAQRMQHMRDMHPSNWEQEPLPRSRYLRIKSTGEVILWHEIFANRPDLCDCCDEQGNIIQREQVTPVTPPPVMNTRLTSPQSHDHHAPETGLAAAKLGVPVPYSGDFTEPTTRNEAMRIPEQNSSVDMSALISAVFKDNVG